MVFPLYYNFYLIVVGFDNFQILRAIGKGSFGKVSIKRRLLFICLRNQVEIVYNFVSGLLQLAACRFGKLMTI